ncbi:hypothetical protein N9181_00200 [bacterium]|nr:hypothetical protein [bacterium]
MIALELTNCGDRFLQQKKYLIMGHDATRQREACKTACAKPKPECTPRAIFRMAETRMPSLPDSLWRDRNQDASLQPREGLLGNVH